LNYVPIPIAMLEIGKPLPVTIWSQAGQLLLRAGQPIVSEQHREKLYAHQASSTEVDAQAWQRAYERMVHTMLREGLDLQEIARAPMPSFISPRDYVVAQQLKSGWLDLQEVLRGILYQGGLAINPAARLAGIENRILSLLKADPDEALFSLFQALFDNSLGYCATHALLCACIGDLTAQKLGFDNLMRQSLMNAALTMNIALAREQDSLSRQNSAPTEWQRAMIAAHPQKSVEILQAIGIDDPDCLDIVRWHHEPDADAALPKTMLARRILSTAYGFVAKMAARKTRSSLSPLSAAKSIYLDAEGQPAALGSAIATAVGFYPPGSYAQLANGDIAVSVQRGARANTPWVCSIIDKEGIPIAVYNCRDSAQPPYNIIAPVNFERVRVTVNAEKIRRARDRI
jgi:hypothetical protein